MAQLFRLDIAVGASDCERASGLLALHAPFGWEEQPLEGGGTRLRLHCEDADFLRALQGTLAAAIPGLRVELCAVEAQDWLAAWKEFFTPVPCGRRFVVLPPWLAQTRDFPGRTPIIIEPRSAFGTGHHASTALCLAAISDLLDAGRLRAGQTFLDLGTGSGVLGLACCKSGLTGLGLDTDPLAIANAEENRACNAVEGFALATGDIEAAAGRRFDGVLANILAQPLMAMAAPLVAALAEGGCLVLSGILKSQADSVEAAYAAQGLPAAQRRHDGEWCALVWSQCGHQP